MEESRTQKSIKNAEVSLIYYFIQLILGFFSRKVFFDYLGSEILGLNTTASNLLGFLNLAELGISASVSYFLYKPLYEKDYNKLNRLVSLQGWIYRNIAFFILIASAILMCFFPVIFRKSPLSIWYAYLTFGTLLFSSLLGYIFNYKQIVLYADQKNYKIQKYVQGTTALKTILQILAISLLPYPFFGWIILEIIGSITTTIILNKVLQKEYSWLKTNISQGKQYIKEYPEVLKKTGQVFFHRLAGVILNQSSPIIIYGFTSLTTVALYGNYILIVNKFSTLIGSVFNSTGAAIGNLIASQNKPQIIKIFWELFDSRLCISTISLICLYNLVNPFITLWLGSQYCLSSNFLLLYILLNSISMTRITVDNYISAYGLYKDIWAPITEASLNISLSIILGYLYSLNGIILGIILSQVIIVLIWKPYFLFKEGIQLKGKNYFIPVLYRYLASILLFTVLDALFKMLNLTQVSDIKNFIINSIIISIITFVFTGLSFYILFKGVRNFVTRIISLIKH